MDASFFDQPERLGIAWIVGTEPHTEEQFQFIELAHAAEGPQVRILCEVVSHMALSPLDALAHNATLAFGALALVGHSYVLRAMFPLEDLSMTTLDRALRLISHEAARIRYTARPTLSAIAHLVVD